MILYHGSNILIRKNRTRIQAHDYDIVIGLLMSERGLSMEDALRTLYTSDTYSKLIDLSTGLYSQSTAYVYEYLDKELSTGKMS